MSNKTLGESVTGHRMRMEINIDPIFVYAWVVYDGSYIPTKDLKWKKQIEEKKSSCDVYRLRRHIKYLEK